MIVYLGMPRSASSWLYDHMSHIEMGVKETHHFYTTPVNLKEYCSKKLDFSTNNWSMDSGIAKEIDQYVTKYLLIFRNPIEFIISYQSVNPQPIHVESLITNKLLCYGDIVQRWYNLVEPEKIIIANYDDLVKNPEAFLLDITTKLEIPMPNVTNPQKTNNFIKNSIVVTDKQIDTIKNQIDKLQTITNLEFKWIINNIL